MLACREHLDVGCSCSASLQSQSWGCFRGHVEEWLALPVGLMVRESILKLPNKDTGW